MHGQQTRTRRFATLDGMRGVAALFVVARHFSDLRGGASEPQFSNLAVDIFFVLSGFVLSLSYGDRLGNGQVSPARFIVLRIVRLYPLYLLGLTISLLLAAYLGLHKGSLSTGSYATMTITSIFLLPTPPMAGLSGVFPANPPTWSLFYEFYIANIAFAVLPFRTCTRFLVFVIIVSAVGVTLTSAAFGSLAVGSIWPNFVGGLPRLSFSFAAGVLLERVHRRHPPRIRLPAWSILVVLATLLSASIGGLFGQIYELTCVFAIFPALIYLGANVVERRPWLGNALGDASYAAYVIHVPLLTVAVALLNHFGLLPSRSAEIVFLLTISLSAYAAHHLFDAPLRKRISRLIS